MSEIKFSIIIPTFFEEKILANLLVKFNNELKNKYHFEVIVSDGGSTDKTVEIARQYADFVVENTTNSKQNISQGRNFGANIAKGNVFVFLNADCMPENFEFFLKTISDFADSNDNIYSNNIQSKSVNFRDYSAIACKVKSFSDCEKRQDKIFYFLHNNYVHFLNILGIGMGRGECQIVRSEIFKGIGGYNPLLAAGEDFDLYRRIKKNKCKILFSKQILINESPRRFRKYGYLKTIWFWTLNSLTVIFFNKSASKNWEPIR